MNPTLYKFLKRFNWRANYAMIGCVFGLCLAGVSPASAEFKVCNNTNSLVGVAIGYKVGEEWTTEGWWRIPADVCTVIIEGELTSRYFYLHAEAAESGGTWRGPIFMCTSSKEFKIVGVSNCFARGYEKTGFFEVDTVEQNSWQVRLTEANQTKKDGSSQ